MEEKKIHGVGFSIFMWGIITTISVILMLASVVIIAGLFKLLAWIIS